MKRFMKKYRFPYVAAVSIAVILLLQWGPGQAEQNTPVVTTDESDSLSVMLLHNESVQNIEIELFKPR